jgi:Ca2+-binding RTX toxin-like protein
MLLEDLEARRLMSASLNPTTHLLTVTGTDAPDTITAAVIGATLKVTENGTPHSYPTSAVARISVFAKGGNDTVTLDPSVHIRAYIDTGAGGTIGADGHPHGDAIRGGSGDDTVEVRSFYATVHGGAGNDTIYVYQGINYIFGDAGNDRIVPKLSGSASGQYDGGTGVDTIDYSAAADGLVVRNGDAGDYYFPDGGTTPTVVGDGADVLAGFENFTGGGGNDYIYGTAGANVIRGNAGNDYVRGGAGNDTIDGGTGHDALFGDEGDDTIYARDGQSDFVSGGAGADQARKDSSDGVSGVEKFLS